MRARKMDFSVGVFPSSFSFVLAVTLSAVAANAVELEDLVVSGAKAEKVVGDCEFTEGPAWSPDGYLLFSDIPNSRIVLRTPTVTNGLIFSTSVPVSSTRYREMRTATVSGTPATCAPTGPPAVRTSTATA